MSALDGYPLVAEGCWAQHLTENDFTGRPAHFLDRDGVIVEETNYLGRAEDVRMIEGVAAAISETNRRGIPVVVVTNQAGVGRGYYGWDDFSAVQACIEEHLSQAGAHLDAVMACAYHRDGRAPYRIAGHPWRKPATGMLDEAARMLGLDLGGSVLVGDTITDLETAREAGLKRAAFVLTGHGSRQHEEHRSTLDGWTANSGFNVEIFANAAAAIRALTTSS